jgi:hypothetical protein
MMALSIISMTVIEAVSAARASFAALAKVIRASTRTQRKEITEEEREHYRERNGCAVTQPTALPITIPSTSPIAQPVRQWRVADHAVRFSEGTLPTACSGCG